MSDSMIDSRSQKANDRGAISHCATFFQSPDTKYEYVLLFIQLPRGTTHSFGHQPMKKFKSWGQLQTVLTVAEVGSYRAAAAVLDITSSTVSRHIDAISQEIGQPIFLPAGNRWELTEVGKELVAIAETTQASLTFMLKDIENRADFFETVQINTLSFINSDFLAPALDLWRTQNPLSEVTIDASDQTTAIERGEADVALRLTRPDTPGIARFKLGNCDVGIYTPEGGDADAWIGLPLDLADLKEMRLAAAHFDVNPVMRMDSFRAIAHASQSTGLSCILPTCMARGFPNLQPVMSGDKAMQVHRELWFLFYETRKNDPAIKAAKYWVKQIFPSPNKCLCGQCA
jgi:DNA-binding transcriptional LysR family regulator